jgi:uncharacterized OsmC-like protein
MTTTPLTFSVEGVSESSARMRMAVRDFTFAVDEPASLGGTDEGPNPVEFVLSALAGCINVVVHMVAAERGVAIRGLRVRVEGELDPARLMALPTDTRAGFSWIELVAEVDSDAPESEIEKILQIAESRCPVADTIGHTTPVTLRRAVTVPPTSGR